MVDAAQSADVGDSAHAGDSAAPWDLSVVASVVHLAQSSLPAVDSVLGINASMMRSPHFIQERESWTESVSKSLDMIKATCSAFEDKLEQGPQYQQVMMNSNFVPATVAISSGLTKH